MSAPAFRNGTTVTLIRRIPSGQDDFGNDTFTEIPVQIGFCGFQPVGSSQDQTQLTDTANLFMPSGTEVSHIDQFEIDGSRWEANGSAESWRSPFTGHQGVVQVPLRRITGAWQGQQQ